MKSNTKKRLIAFMLCMVLVLSSATSAFADDLDTQAQDQTTTMAESETQASVADEPVATSMDDSTDEQQPVAEAEGNQEQAVETPSENEEAAPAVENPTTEAPEEQQTEAPAENEEPATEETQPILQLTYEDDNVKVTVDAVDAGNIPDGASLSVTPIIKKEITDSMSDKEKEEVKAMNDQYDHTEKKLQEKAKDEPYDIAGFLAYDITFVDADGNKLEPNGDVKVSMEYKKAEIPEEAKKVQKEKKDEQELDVTVMHLEEDEQGKVKEVADLSDATVQNGSLENLKTNNDKKIEKIEFVANSFSTFTITWKKYYSNSGDLKLTLHFVDETGNELQAAYDDQQVSYNETIDFSTSYSTSITGYSYINAKLGSIDGDIVTSAEGSYNYSKEEYQLTLKNDNTTIKTLKKSGSANIYLIYRQNTSSGGDSGNTPTETDMQLSHEKYIKKKDDNKYDVTLNVSSKKGTKTSKKKLDILLIVDRSGSMDDEDRMENAKLAVNNLCDSLDTPTSTIDARYKLVSFSRIGTIDTENWVTGTQMKAAVSRLNAVGGTNYEDAFLKAAQALTGMRNGAETIVIFLTDGVPTRRNLTPGQAATNDNQTTTDKHGSETNNAKYTQATTAVAQITCNRFMAIGLSLSSGSNFRHSPYDKVPNTPLKLLQGITDAATDAAERDKAVNITDPTKLPEKFNQIAADIQKFACKDVTIKDTLSEYVDTTTDSKLQIRMAKKITENGTDTYTDQGSVVEISLTDSSLFSDAGKNVTVNNKSLGTVKYNATNKQVIWNLGANYELEDDIYYYITITNVTPNAAAEKVYKDNKGGYGESKGDANTDASSNGYYGTMGTENDTSSNLAGFPSNNNADHNSSVTYTNTKTGVPATEDYQKPVVQVDVKVIEGGIETGKTAKVNNWDDRTYDITLNATSTLKEISSIAVAKPIEVAFVFDTSGSMLFRSSLTPAVYGTKAALAKNQVYYYMDSDAKATMYRVYYESGNWNYIDDSYWDYSTGKLINGKKQTLSNDTRQYYTTSDSHNRFYYLKKAATEFTTKLAETSADSKLALVTFNKKATTEFEFQSVGTKLDYITNTINSLTTSGGTHQNEGLDKAYNILNNDKNEQNLTRYVVLLTDGCPNGVTYDQVTSSVADIKTTGAKLITIGVGLDSSNESLKTARTKLTEYADGGMAYMADNATSLSSIFDQILRYTTNPNEKDINATGVTVTDYIDSRFELPQSTIDSLRTRYGNDVEIKAPGEAGNTTDMWLIIWKNQTVNHASKDADGTTIAGWSTTFTVKAKDSYIGDNNVTTNGSGSGVSYDGNTTPFPQPTVNVKSQLKVDDNSVTIYKGDQIPTDKDILNQLFNKSDTTSYTEGTVNEDDFKKLSVEWYSNPECTIPITTAEMAAITPDTTTAYYFLKVTYKTSDPTNDSNANTTKDGTIYISGGTEQTTVAVNKNDSNKKYGTYTVNVINGEIQIIKNLAAGSNAKDGDQFTFMITKDGTPYSVVLDKTKNYYRPATEEEITNGTASSTVTITVVSSNNTLTGNVSIKELPRGSYEVSEHDQTDYVVESVVIDSQTNCWSNNLTITDEKATFGMGYNKTAADANVIVKDNTAHTYKHDNSNGAGQLGVVTYTNETVISDWGIQKVSSSDSNLVLSGAQFELKNSDTTYIGVSSNTGYVNWYTSYTDETTNVPLTGKMNPGTYTLTETKAPAGYARSNEIWTVEIKRNGSLKMITSSSGKTLSTLTQTSADGKKTITLYQFKNTPVYDLPSAGGNGIYLYMIGGVLLMFAAAWILYINKCREVLKR